MPRQLILVRCSDPRTAGSCWMLQSSILAGKGWKPDLKASLLPPATFTTLQSADQRSRHINASAKVGTRHDAGPRKRVGTARKNGCGGGRRSGSRM